MSEEKTTNCVWNNLSDKNELGLCDAEPGAYPILPGDCPCINYEPREFCISRCEQIEKRNTGGGN